MQKRRGGFSLLTLKKESEEERLTERERKRVPDYMSDVLKASLPQSPPAHPRNTEGLNIRS